MLVVMLSALRNSSYPFAPYCGAPPVPGELAYRWNLDPVLIAALVGTLAVYAWSARASGLGRSGRAGLFYIGWALGFLALISPLCPLSVALFSARVGQHMLLTTVVAPLIVVGRPGEVIGRAWPALRFSRFPAPPAWLAAGVFAAILWFWHAPGPYTATFRTDAIYWAMHITTFGAALWLWSALLRGEAKRMMDTAAALAITSLQMGVLGAIVTFAPRSLYPPHALITWAWGLSPLSDQQLGGAIMWIPAGIIMALAAVAPLAVVLRDPAFRSGVRARPA